MFDLAVYKAIPGKDPDRDDPQDGPGTFNPYRHCVGYGVQDVVILHEVWERYSREVTMVTQRDSYECETHTPCAGNMRVISMDAGSKNTGLCVVEHRADSNPIVQQVALLNGSDAPAYVLTHR